MKSCAVPQIQVKAWSETKQKPEARYYLLVGPSARKPGSPRGEEMETGTGSREGTQRATAVGTRQSLALDAQLSRALRHSICHDGL